MAKRGRPKKRPVSEAKRRAALQNLEKARAQNAKRNAEQRLKQFNEGLRTLDKTVRKEIEDAISQRFEKVDRKDIKDEILRVFMDAMGSKGMKKLAKTEPKFFMNKVVEILKAETSKESGEMSKGTGVTVNIFGLDGKQDSTAIDVTPVNNEEVKELDGSQHQEN
jgi:hypothetical protein